jgi:hypothetical protein
MRTNQFCIDTGKEHSHNVELLLLGEVIVFPVQRPCKHKILQVKKTTTFENEK